MASEHVNKREFQFRSMVHVLAWKFMFNNNYVLNNKTY